MKASAYFWVRNKFVNCVKIDVYILTTWPDSTPVPHLHGTKNHQFRARGQVKICPAGKKWVRCTSTWWDESDKLDLVWIHPVVIAVGCLQSPNYQKTAISCPWASQNLPGGQIMGPLHIYMVRRIQWTWFGENPSSSFGDMVFTKSGTDGRTHGRTDGRRRFHSPPLRHPTDGRGTKTMSTVFFNSCWLF